LDVSDEKEIQFSKGEYPELDGLESGSSIKIRADAKVVWDGDNGRIQIEKMDIETENRADREFKAMRAQPESQENMAGMTQDEEDSF
jgi:hypothetical protein